MYFNVQGQSGATGVTGTTGPTGATGATGPEFSGYYGSFYDTSTQMNPIASTARPMILNEVIDGVNGVIANGVFIVLSSGTTMPNAVVSLARQVGEEDVALQRQARAAVHGGC